LQLPSCIRIQPSLITRLNWLPLSFEKASLALIWISADATAWSQSFFYYDLSSAEPCRTINPAVGKYDGRIWPGDQSRFSHPVAQIR